GPAPWRGAVFLALERAGVIFMGDLFFNARFPWLGDCDLDGWIAAIDRVLAMDAKTVIPGDCAPASPAECRQFRNLLAALRDAVDHAIKSGWSEDASARDVALPN